MQIRYSPCCIDRFQFECFNATSIIEIDQDAVISDLAADMQVYDPAHYFQYLFFPGYHHAVLVKDDLGRYVALLGTMVERYQDQYCLAVKTGFVANGVQNKGLMSRMIAKILAELATLGIAPGFLTAQTHACRTLQNLGAVLPSPIFRLVHGPNSQPSQTRRSSTMVAANWNTGVRSNHGISVTHEALPKAEKMFRHSRPRGSVTDIDNLNRAQISAISLVLHRMGFRDGLGGQDPVLLKLSL